LKLSNVCNLKCRMCAAKSSSLIQKEANHYPEHSSVWLSNKIIGTDNEQRFLAKLANTTFIELTGGEPFVSPENKKLIQLIANTEHVGNINIRITTNGMTVNKVVLEHLKKFKHASVTFSIDDIHDRLYYSRSGAIHDQIVSNLNTVQEAGIHIEVYCTVNNYNIWFLPELDSYFDNVCYGHLSYPQHLNIQSLPVEVKKQVASKLSDTKWTNVVRFMQSEDINMGNSFFKHNDRLDKIRNTNFKQTFNQWADILYEFV
jgi:MoaA/NifB/PqqE/SkfB family radical SAM enzyme